MIEYSMEKFLGLFVAGLVGIVAYFLRMAHKETKGDLKELNRRITDTEARYIAVEAKQTELERAIKTEMEHIREVMETRLGSIDSNIQMLINRK